MSHGNNLSLEEHEGATGSTMATGVTGRSPDGSQGHACLRDASSGQRCGIGYPLPYEWLAVGGYWLDAANLHRYGGHELLNLRGSWQFTDRWSASVRIDNALDRAYADRADYAFGTYRYFPGRPRTIFLGFTLRSG